MEVDAGADRQAKGKPIETTPQIAKKTKKDEIAEGGSAPPNIPIATPKGRQEVPSSSSKTQSVPRPRRGRSRQKSHERRGSPPISASVAVEATEAAPNEGWYSKQQKQLANQGQTVVTMDMLQKCLQVLQDSQGKIEQKLDDNVKQTNRNADKIRALTRQAVYLMTKRAAVDEQSAKQYDIVGIPKQATQEDVHSRRNRSHESLSQKLRCPGNEQRHGRTRDLETHIQRLHIQDSHQRVLQGTEELEHGALGNKQTSLKGISDLGKRWTEGTVGQIVRDSVNTIFRALTDAIGKEAIWASDGCSIDYRMSGIYEKTDRAPRVVIIYSEKDAAPRIYICSYPPDDLTMDDWVKCMEHHFEEYYDKKLGGSKRTNTNTTVTKTPRYLEDRMPAFGRSYRNMKHLDEDYPDFVKQLTDHAVKTLDAQKGKKGKGKNKGKGGWDASKTDKEDEKQKEEEQGNEGEQNKGDERAKGKGKTKRIPSPSNQYYEMKEKEKAAARAAAEQATAQANWGQGKGTQYPYPYPAQNNAWKGDAGKGNGTWGAGGGAFGSNWKPGGNSGW